MRLTGGQRFAVLASVLALIACAPAAARAVTFGSDLSQPADAPLRCEQGVLNQFTLEFLFGPFNGNCTWSSVVVGSASESLTAPGTGTVTAVRVKMGPNTGPMQIDVVRFLFRQTGNPGKPELACCFLEAYGPVFEPPANAITTVPTNLHVTVEPTPPPEDTTTIAATDQLALSSLNPSVQVPLFATNNGGNDLNVLSYAWYPAPTAGNVPAPSPNPINGFADLSGFKVLMNADFEAAGGGGGGGAVPAAGGAAPTPALAPAPLSSIAFPKLTIPVKNGTATLPIQCLVVNCSGVLSLQNAQPGGTAGLASTKKAKKPKLVSYGTSAFSLKAGATGKVKVKLNAVGRKLVKAHKQIKVWANIRFTAGGGRSKSTRVTLKR
jgi:hypothetical protein